VGIYKPISPDSRGANPPKVKFFSTVARLKTSLVEFSHLLDQSSQARGHLRLAPFVVDVWGEQKLVHPLSLNMHIN
jgi:hypothetical protein